MMAPVKRVFFAVVIFSLGRLATAQISTVNYYSIAPNTFVSDIATGSDGALWFTDCEQDSCASFAIGRITTAGAHTEYPTPGRAPRGITSGPDGALWFTDWLTNSIGRICASNSSAGCTFVGSVTEYPISTANSFPSAIRQGPDGALWFTEETSNQIGRICASTSPNCLGIGDITEYPLPSATTRARKITAGPDGAMWFTETPASKIGRICVTVTLPKCPAIGYISEYPTPTPASAPYDITTGPDGALWFTEGIGNIGRITVGGQISEYPANRGYDRLYLITAGPDGALWFTSSYSDTYPYLGRIDTTGAFPKYYPTIGVASGLTNGLDGSIWIGAPFPEIDQVVLTQRQATGTIQVTTNLSIATFSILGPASFTGSGTSATFPSAAPGTYTIHYDPVPGFITPSVPPQTLMAGGTIAFSGQYIPTVPPPSITSISPLWGIQGQTVSTFTVNGANFQAGAAVAFSGGGITANILNITANQIIANLTVSTGAAAGLRDVMVTNTDLQYATLAAGFTVLRGEFSIFSGGPNHFATEPSVAADPTNPLHAVVAFNEFTGDPNGTTGQPLTCSWAETMDGGLHWTTPPGSLSLPPEFQPAGDPWVRFDLQGHLLYSCMAGSKPNRFALRIGAHMQRNAVFVAKSPSAFAKDFPALKKPVVSAISGDAVELEDHPAIAVMKGPSASGRIVLCWTDTVPRGPTTSAFIKVAYSDDGEQWTVEPTPLGVGSTCSVGGSLTEVLVTWWDYRTTPGQLLFRSSTDGVNWFAQRMPNFLASVGSLVSVTDCLSCTFDSTTDLVSSVPYALVLPGKGTPEVVWQTNDSRGISQVFFGLPGTHGTPLGDVNRKRFLPGAGPCNSFAGAYQADEFGSFRYSLWNLNNLQGSPIFTSTSALNPHNGYLVNGDFSNGRRIGDYTGVDCTADAGWAVWTDTRSLQPAIWGFQLPLPLK